MQSLGRISYTFYLIHVPALLVAGRYFKSESAVALVALAVALLYSVASWRWLEQPVLFWKPKSRIRRESEQDEKAIATPASTQP